jgi:hypothetical protein
MPEITPSQSQATTLPTKVIDLPTPRVLSKPVVVEASPAPVENTTPAPVIDPAEVFARKEAKYKDQLAASERARAQADAELQALAELKSFKEKLAKKDYSELSQLVNYEEYTNFLIEQAGASDPAKAELNALKAEVASLKDTQKSEIDKLFDRVVSERRSEVKQIVSSNPELSTIKELGEEEAVVQHILDTYEADGIELTVAQAAKEVEEALLEQARTWTSLSKLKPKEAAAPVQASPKVTTLTNDMQATGEIKRISKPLREISNIADRLREARLRLAEKQAKRQ